MVLVVTQGRNVGSGLSNELLFHDSGRTLILPSKSADKDFIVVEGSMTSIGADTNCAKPASEYANARKRFSTTRQSGSMTGSEFASAMDAQEE
jgi:hypothetical protein